MQTRREFLARAGAGAVLMLHDTQAKADAAARGHRLWIGTSNPSASGGAGKGIYVAEFEDGHLTAPQLALVATSPSFLAVNRSASSPLFAVLGGDGANSQAASYSRPSAQDTTLHPIAHADAGGLGGCHISITPDGRAAFVANYVGGSVASLAVDAPGKLTQASLVQFPPEEHGPVTDRQEKAHAHSAVLSPDGGFVLVNDLGLDRIHIFAFDRATAKLLPHKPDHWASAPGAGPRHLVFHPNGRWIYCINEINCTINQLEWNAAHGVLITRGTVPTLPANVDATGAKACEMAFSKDARFLYAATRVHEYFTVFAVDEATGALTAIQHLPNPGVESRHITLDPGGKWLLSANQFSGDISVFPIDVATGKLGERVSSVPLGGPSCLLFA